MKGMNAWLRGEGPAPTLREANATERRVYDHLEKPAQAGDLAYAMEIHPDKVRRALYELARVGLVRYTADGTYSRTIAPIGWTSSNAALAREES